MSMHCPANTFLEIDGDKAECNEKSYMTVKPPRPRTKEGDVVSFVKLYIDVAVGKPSVKISFE